MRIALTLIVLIICNTGAQAGLARVDIPDAESPLRATDDRKMSIEEQNFRQSIRAKFIAPASKHEECGAVPSSQTTRRVALVIGNNVTKNYTIDNGVNDAGLIASTLCQNGFEVTAHYDRSRQEMVEVLTQFSARIRGLSKQDVVLLYYAGNGFEIGRMSYVATTDSVYPTDPALEQENLRSWLSLNEVLQRISIHDGPKIVILDTCRNDPFANSRGGPPERAPNAFRPPKNTLIAYATEPGREALDGFGTSNGPYAAALMTALNEPRRTAEELFRRVRELVEDYTHGKQFPFVESGLRQEVFLTGKPDAARLPSAPEAIRAVDSGKAGKNRVALLIGNSKYQAVNPLKNPENDALELAKAFRRLRFTKVVEAYNLTLEEMRLVLRDFAIMSEDADWAVIYFAGHGFEYDQKPYVVPVDAKLEKDSQIDLEAMLVFQMLDSMKARQFDLLIMDACRDNPFIAQMEPVVAKAHGLKFASGLPEVELDHDNVLVAYAAKHGTRASDGLGAHSPYATALLDFIERPDLEIDMLFRMVRDAVRRSTDGFQQPFTYGSLSSQQMYFKALQ